VRIRGRKQLPVKPVTKTSEYSNIHTDIPSAYWANTEINVLATSEESAVMRHVNPETAYSWGPKGLDERESHEELLVNWPDVKKVWPL
jgi:hypothetical protein